MSSDLLVKWELSLPLPEPKLCKTSELGDRMWAGLWGAGLAARTEAIRPEKVLPMSMGGGGAGLGVSQLVRVCWHCTGPDRCSCSYAEGQGVEMVSAISFVPRQVLCERFFSGVHSKGTNNLSTVPQVLFRWMFSCCMLEGCLSAFSPKATQWLLGSIPAKPAHLLNSRL